MARIYLVFHTTHETLKAESLLQAAAVPAKVVMKPAAIRLDCGLAVRTAPEHQPAALETLTRGGVQPRGVFTL